MRQAGNEAVADRIDGVSYNDGNRAGRLLQRTNAGGQAGDEDIHFRANEFRRQLRQAFVLAISRTPFADEILALDITEFTHPLLESTVQPPSDWCAWQRGEKPDAPDLARLLRACRDRPRRRRAAEQHDELAPSHSIT